MIAATWRVVLRVQIGAPCGTPDDGNARGAVV
jgi:hypothetical protein